VPEARRAIDAAFATLARTGEVVWSPMLHLLRAQVRLGEDSRSREAARGDLETALSVAREQGAARAVGQAEAALAALAALEAPTP
jgi:hypothetical protein